MHLFWLICCNQSYDNPLIVKLLEFDNQRTFIVGAFPYRDVKT